MVVLCLKDDKDFEMRKAAMTKAMGGLKVFFEIREEGSMPLIEVLDLHGNTHQLPFVGMRVVGSV